MINSSSKCKSCGALILWMKTKFEKWIPVDFDEKFLNHGQFDPDIGHVPHFATCPNAREHADKIQSSQKEFSHRLQKMGGFNND